MNKHSQLGHSLLPQEQKDCSMAALPATISTEDEPKIKKALVSPDKKEWIIVIDEELNTPIENETWKMKNLESILKGYP